MKDKLVLAMLFGLAFISPIFIIAVETNQSDLEEVNVPQPVRAKDGENGAPGGLITNGQDGQKGKNGQDGGKGGNSWVGRGGNGGNGGDAD